MNVPESGRFITPAQYYDNVPKIEFSDANRARNDLPTISSRNLRTFTQAGLLLSQRLAGGHDLADSLRVCPSDNRWSTDYIQRAAPSVVRLGPNAPSEAHREVLAQIADASGDFVSRIKRNFHELAYRGAYMGIISVNRAAQLSAVCPGTLRNRGLVRSGGQVSVDELLNTLKWSHITLPQESTSEETLVDRVPLVSTSEAAGILSYSASAIFWAANRGLLLAMHMTPDMIRQQKRGDFRYPLPYLEKLAAYTQVRRRQGPLPRNIFSAFIEEAPTIASDIRQSFDAYTRQLAGADGTLTTDQAAQVTGVSWKTLSNYGFIAGPNQVPLDPYLDRICWHHATFDQPSE